MGQTIFYASLNDFCRTYLISNRAVTPIELADFSRRQLEGFPDLKALYKELHDPFQKLPQLRAKRSSMQFRDWLFAAKSLAADSDITRDYVDSIADAKGFFETRRGKFTKSIVMTAIGGSIGAIIGGAEGAIGGVAVAKTLEIGSDLALDLADEFLISELTKGWSPRMFFDDLRRLRNKSG
jgi:hypothetical protein